ncbi:MAG TPA: HAD hydrolase-like protein [Blastocatellia bacterium]|nr:HAD hydrolase-like protein [Blastocatellia bacterium]
MTVLPASFANAANPRAGEDGREPHFPRILLFDIDGTLIRTARRGEYLGLIRQTLVEIFGSCGRISEVDFAGKTDLGIYKEAFESEGVDLASILSRLPDIEEGMSRIIDQMAVGGAVYHLCSGVRELLEALGTDSRFIPSLLTGNLERLAEVKLRHAGIWRYFRGRGAFGDESVERDHLPEIAARRFSELLGTNLAPTRFVIIGDTPRDISCARYFGARVVAVASGKHSVGELSECNPDAVLPDLSVTGDVIDLLARI